MTLFTQCFFTLGSKKMKIICELLASTSNWSAGLVVKIVFVEARWLEFDTQVGQIGHSVA